MNKLIKYLNQPDPARLEGNRLKVIIVASLLVFFVLVIFQPFGLNQLKDNLIIIPFGYMLVTAGSLSFATYLLPYLFENYYNPDNWTVWKSYANFLLIILFISLGNAIYSIFVFHFGFTLNTLFVSFLYYLVYTFSIGIIPMIVTHYLQQNSYLKRNLEEAQELSNSLSKRTIARQETFVSDAITLFGNTKESIDIHPEQLLFLEACGNYVKINYLEDGTSKQKLLRVTIKQVEDALKDIPYIIRCHRAFLVNTEQIAKVKGNSQGYKLLFQSTEEEIPVSRAYTKEVKERLSKNGI